MSLSLHPDWHTTDNAEVSVPVHTSKQHRDTTIHRYAVRHPAAIVGVLFVMGLGMVFVQGVQELRGQVGAAAVIVRITVTGLEPQDLSLSPGQTITWRNEQDVPHILTSDALPVEGGTLYTPHILPGEDYSTSISPQAELGDFTYVSLTAENITGKISIVPTAAIVPTPLTNRPTVPRSPLTPKPLMPARPLAPLASIPRNPYALEETALPQFIPSQPPSFSPPTASALPPLATTVRPFTQPQTGPRGMGATLVVSMLLVIGLCLRLTRKIHS